MADMLSIGIRGLLAFQNALTVTTQNIDNVNTPFYSRKQINFVEAVINNGVDISDVRRVYSGFASYNYMQANSEYGMSDTYLEQLSQISGFLGNDKNNINTYLNDSLSALRELNSHADSTTNRSLYLQQLNILTGRFNAIGQQLHEQQVNINNSMQTITGNISKLAENIAAINQQITDANGSNVDSLLDQREAQIQELAQYVDITTTVDNSGQITVMLSNGTPLVVTNHSYVLSAIPNPANSNTMIMSLAAGSGNIDVTSVIHGGQLAGLYKSQADLQNAIHSLDRLSLGIMAEFNKQNKLGIDANYKLGGDIFANINDANYTTQRAYNNVNNVGTADVSVDINNVSQLNTSDYKLVFDTASHYILTRLSDNTVVSSGAVSSLPQQISVDGFSININGGTISAGDNFTITPTNGMAQGMRVSMTDPSLLALGWPVDTTANSKDGHIEVTDILDTTNSAFSTPGQLTPPIKVVFTSATTYQLRNADTDALIEDNLVYNPNTGSDVFPTAGSYDPGYRVHLSGNIQSGDTFNINYTTNNQSDIRNGKKMDALYSRGVFEGNKNMTFNSAYNLFSSMLAIQTNAAQTAFKGDKIVFDNAKYNYAQISQVSIQEEMTNLDRYNEAYQASAQVIEIAKSIFDTVIAIGRR